LFLPDLEALRPQFQAFYHPKPRGALPRDPNHMFRSLLCLILSGRTLSFTAWVKILRSQLLFAALSGSEDRTPGIGAFYDFSRRLFPETTDSIVRRAIFKPKASDKDRRPRPGIVQRLVTKALDDQDKPLPAFPALRLNLLLKPIVLHSHALGLLTSAEAVDLVGDGTKFKTGASSSGRKLCDCRKLGVYRCDCPRLYSDRFASWGWDSYHECFIYGHAFYELTASSSPFDLPIFLLLAQAKDHDSATGVKALDRARKLYPELFFASFIGDSAHDNYPTYNLLAAHSINPIIALNDRRSGHYQLDGDFTTDSSGVPVCPKRERMAQSVSALTDADRNGVVRAPLTVSPSLASAPLQLMAAPSTPNPRMIRACSPVRRATQRPGRRPSKIGLAPSAHTNARRSISTSNRLAFVRGANGRCASS